MKAWTNVAVMISIVMLWASGSHAVPPAYTGPMGNPEEPALRPYKWLWHGAKAFLYQPVDALDRGNRKVPGLGSVEVFQGFRKGAVEIDESLFRGATFSEPPQAEDYKKLGKANTYIDNDLLLRNVADFIAASYVWTFAEGGLGTEAIKPLCPFYPQAIAGVKAGFVSNAARSIHLSPQAFRLAVGIYLGEKAVEISPVNTPETQEELRQHAVAVREARKQDRADRTAKAALEKSPVRRAQEAYLGSRAEENRKPKLKGNLVDLAR